MKYSTPTCLLDGKSSGTVLWRGRGERTLALALGLVIAISFHARADSATPQASPPANSKFQITPHMRGAPLPSGPNAPSEKDFQKIYTAWLNRTIMAHYPVDKDPAGAAFVRAAVNFLGSNPKFSASSDLVSQERAFLLPSVNEPALLFMIGAIEPPSVRQRAAFDKALSLFPGSAYPKFIWFTAAANVGEVAHNSYVNADQLKTDDELSLKYLDEGLHDDSFLPSEMSALRWRFGAGSFKDFFSRNQQRVADIFESSSNIDPWVKNYVEGVKFVNAAWDARGRDWANTVTPQGWQGFAQNLAFARAHLVDSWNQNPHDPAAAGEMMSVCMGENEEPDTMRTWFDRAVAADFDYLEAYANMRWGLRPRWLGSYAEMNAFGQECAATGRYDTLVPYQRVVAALDISADSEDHGAQFQDPETASEVLLVLNACLAQPKPNISVPVAHTIAAIVAHKAGRMDEVMRHLAALDYKPVMASWSADLDDLPALVSQIQAPAAPQTPPAPPSPPTP